MDDNCDARPRGALFDPFPCVAFADQAAEDAPGQLERPAAQTDITRIFLAVIEIEQCALPLILAGFLGTAHDGLSDLFRGGGLHDLHTDAATAVEDPDMGAIRALPKSGR